MVQRENNKGSPEKRILLGVHYTAGHVGETEPELDMVTSSQMATNDPYLLVFVPFVVPFHFQED